MKKTHLLITVFATLIALAGAKTAVADPNNFPRITVDNDLTLYIFSTNTNNDHDASLKKFKVWKKTGENSYAPYETDDPEYDALLGVYVSGINPTLTLLFNTNCDVLLVNNSFFVFKGTLTIGVFNNGEIPGISVSGPTTDVTIRRYRASSGSYGTPNLTINASATIDGNPMILINDILYVNGTAERKIIFDGGAKFSGDDARNGLANNSTDDIVKNCCLLYTTGEIHMQHATLQNSYTKASTSTNGSLIFKHC